MLIGVVMLILPSLGQLDANVGQFGQHATETPLPLSDSSGQIVYPGFPADVLFKFRLYSVIDQLILWTTIGLGLRSAGRTAARARPASRRRFRSGIRADREYGLSVPEADGGTRTPDPIRTKSDLSDGSAESSGVVLSLVALSDGEAARGWLMWCRGLSFGVSTSSLASR